MERFPHGAIFTVLVLVLLLQVGSVFATGDEEQASSDTETARQSRIDHSIFEIDGDSEFASMVSAEGWKGDGSAGNPYIIENLDINGSGNHYCIIIRHTTVHFIIRNCSIHDADSGSWSTDKFGLLLDEVENATIHNNTFFNSIYWGVQAVDSKNIRITNNYIHNQTFAFGVSIIDSVDVLVKENLCISQHIGLNIESDGVLIEKNNCSGNQRGIYVRGSDNHLNNNTLLTNEYWGLAIQGSGSGIYGIPSTGNVFKNNTLTSSGVLFTGGIKNWTGQDMDTSNTVNGKPVVYWKNRNSGTVPDAGQIILANCTGVNVFNRNIKDCPFAITLGYSNDNHLLGNFVSDNIDTNLDKGIYLYYSNNNIIEENVFPRNWGGAYIIYSNWNVIRNNYFNDSVTTAIYLEFSHNNTISENTFYLNRGGLNLKESDNNEINNNTFSGNDLGITIYDSSFYDIETFNNSIHHNNFFDSIRLCYDKGHSTKWDDGSQGNFWSNYSQRYPSATNDGTVWDTPYTLNGSAGFPDNYPLVNVVGMAPITITDYTSGSAATGEQKTFRCQVLPGCYSTSAWIELESELLSPSQANISLERRSIAEWDLTISIPEDQTGQINYTYHATDVFGQWAISKEYSFQVIDYELPWLVDLSPKNATTGDPFLFNASAFDNVAVEKVQVSYNHLWTNRFQQNYVDMDRAGGNWTLQIITDPEPGGLFYFFTVLDTSGNNYTTEQFYVPNRDNDPPAVETGGNVTCYVGDTVTFNASGCRDNYLPQAWGHLNYSWSFMYNGNGVVLSDCLASFTFGIIGNYSVSLTVKDRTNNSANGSLWVNVLPLPDTEAPSILNVTWSETINPDDWIQVSADIRDNTGVAGAFIEFRGINGSIIKLNGTGPVSGDRWTFDILPQGEQGQVKFKIGAVDISQNWNETQEYSIDVINYVEPVPPYVVRSDPTNNTKDFPISEPIFVWFSKPMNRTAVESAVDVLGVENVDFGWEESRTKLRLNFTKGHSSEYIIVIRKEATDLAGLPLASEYRFSFITEDAGGIPDDDDDDDTNNTNPNGTNDDDTSNGNEDDDEVDNSEKGYKTLIIILVLVVLIIAFTVGILIYLQKAGSEDDEEKEDDLGRVRAGGFEDLDDEFQEWEMEE